jgi:hypothetical protein
MGHIAPTAPGNVLFGNVGELGGRDEEWVARELAEDEGGAAPRD